MAPRIFVNHADTGVGRMLCSELRAFASGRNLLYGTQLGADATKMPKAVRRVIPKSQPKVLLRTLPQCAVVVYCIQNTDIDEMGLVLGALESYDFEKPFTFVLVSSAETWGRTEPVVPGEEGVEPTDVLTDAEFESRKPLPGFEQWLSIENRVLAMNKRCGGNVETYVVNSGVLYGMGEEAFHDLFKAAWLSQAPATIGGSKGGDNFVPCCHVRDCARLVKIVASTSYERAAESEKNYFVAVDRAQLSQGDIVRSIFSHLSDAGEPPIDNAYLPPPALALDLKLAPSAQMAADDFEWSHADGIIADIATITDQFTKARGLRPVRVVVAGPPLVGKSVQARLVAEHFNLPLISSASVIAEAKASEAQIGVDLRLLLEELEVDQEGEARVPADRMLGLFQWKLGSNVCKSRGFVLDGFPRTVEEAHGLFMVEEEAEEGAPPPEDGEERPKAPSTRMPAFVVEFDSSHDTLERRIKSMVADDVVQGHNDSPGLQRRLAAHGDRIAASGSCVEFFQDLKVESLHIDIDAESASDPKDLFEMIRLYMEAKGRPDNYLESAESVDARRQAELEAIEQDFVKEKDAAKFRRMSAKAEGAQAEAEIETGRLKLIARHEEMRQATLQKPLRPFLMECAIPSLSDALVELCRASPEDPLEFLATYLESEALVEYKS